MIITQGSQNQIYSYVTYLHHIAYVLFPTGATHSELCPVSAVLSFMVARGNQPGPLFMRVDGKFLTRAKFVTEVQRVLKEMGFPAGKYAGHSFRIGAATAAGRCGIQDSLIIC